MFSENESTDFDLLYSNQVSQIVQSLCILDDFEDAYAIWSNAKTLEKYNDDMLPVRYKLALSSYVQDSLLYFYYLKDWARYDGDFKSIKFNTDPHFFSIYAESIFDEVLLMPRKDPAQLELDSTLWDIFFLDQFIRSSDGKSILELKTIKQIDSLNLLKFWDELYSHLPMFEFRSTKYMISTLFRHISLQYLEQLRRDELLFDLINKEVLTIEAYSSISDYILSQSKFFTTRDLSVIELNEVNQRRKSIGLIPLQISPTYILRKRREAGFTYSAAEVAAIKNELLNYSKTL